MKYIVAAMAAEAVSRKYNIPPEELAELFAEMPRVDDALTEAVSLLEENYWKAQTLGYVGDPIGWAVYHTWWVLDRAKDKR